MIGNKIQAMFLENQDHFLIPASEVAHVQTENKLSHALLVLTKIGFNVIVVLDKDSHVKGLISIPLIMEAITSIHQMNYDQLDVLTVGEVMKTEFAVLDEDYELEDMLHLLVDNPFICTVDAENKFSGIITRREILKSVNHLVHEFEQHYDVREKEETICN
ncbi:CBS domain-containing protein [Desemzia sp. RIT804]|uniref:cyclic-di-AMP-binding protein CbpB n=1 Tax=Desemzia sp. RIT 804 TaxID=2810209 RepID=UPI001952451F|nr:cyclic-di-AMP-binding protein CbpB [Desemzia sp. RIT 804]MBM6613331.1 CBS domain-containing protein [Desemzia sp. RIT 804]